MSDQRPARKITCEDMDMEEELRSVLVELLELSMALGAWGVVREASDLDRIITAAHDVAVAAMRVEQIARQERDGSGE